MERELSDDLAAQRPQWKLPRFPWQDDRTSTNSLAWPAYPAWPASPRCVKSPLVDLKDGQKAPLQSFDRELLWPVNVFSRLLQIAPMPNVDEVEVSGSALRMQATNTVMSPKYCCDRARQWWWRWSWQRQTIPQFLNSLQHPTKFLELSRSIAQDFMNFLWGTIDWIDKQIRSIESRREACESRQGDWSAQALDPSVVDTMWNLRISTHFYGPRQAHLTDLRRLVSDRGHTLGNISGFWQSGFCLRMF